MLLFLYITPFLWSVSSYNLFLVSLQLNKEMFDISYSAAHSGPSYTWRPSIKSPAARPTQNRRYPTLDLRGGDCVLGHPPRTSKRSDVLIASASASEDPARLCDQPKQPRCPRGSGRRRLYEGLLCGGCGAGVSGCCIAGRSGSKSSLGGDSLDSRRSQGSPERRKSILKHRDPETEQLLPDFSIEPPSLEDKHGRPTLKGIGPRAGGKPHALPVKFVGMDEEEDSNRPRRILPRSPMPRRHPQRAPLADLLADFAGQEKAARDEATPENILKDSLETNLVSLAESLDQRNANTVLRCSKAPCLYNQPASTSPMALSPGGEGVSLLCLCGAPMTRVPAAPAIITPTSTTAARPITENCLLTDDLNNGPATLGDIDDLLFVDHTPTEETRLLERALNLPRNNSGLNS